MEDIFGWAAASNQPIGEWSVSQVTTMSEMFEGAQRFDQPTGEWNVSQVATI